MKSTVVLATVLHLASLAMAIGTPRSPSAMAFPSPAQEVDFFEKRQQIDKYFITLCENSNYLGRCAKIQAAWGICRTSYFPFTLKQIYLLNYLLEDTIIQENNDWASSAKADAGGNCVVYT